MRDDSSYEKNNFSLKKHPESANSSPENPKKTCSIFSAAISIFIISPLINPNVVFEGLFYTLDRGLILIVLYVCEAVCIARLGGVFMNCKFGGSSPAKNRYKLVLQPLK